MPVSQGLKNGLNKIREISSDIYHRYIPIIDDDTDIGAFANPILTYPEVYDEFVKSLLYKLSYVQFETKYFRNPLKVLEGDRVPLGYAGQGIYVNPAKGRRFNPNDFAGILAKYEADVKVEYYALNMDTQYPVSIQRQSLKKAFTSWGELESFIDQLSNSLYNGAYIDEYRFTKNIVAAAYKDNKAVIETVSAVSSEATAKAFTTKAREMFLNFQSPSTEFNAWHLMGGEGNPVTTVEGERTIPEKIYHEPNATIKNMECCFMFSNFGTYINRDIDSYLEYNPNYAPYNYLFNSNTESWVKNNKRDDNEYTDI